MQDSDVSITVDGNETNTKYELCNICGSEDMAQYTHETDDTKTQWRSCNNCGASAVVAWDDLESITLTIVDTEGE